MMLGEANLPSASDGPTNQGNAGTEEPLPVKSPSNYWNYKDKDDQIESSFSSFCQ